MTNFENNWWLYFVPECYFDTVLVAKILRADKKRLLHRKGCNNVVNDLNSQRLKNSFAVGIVDKDKTELDYFKDCTAIYNADKLILWKHKDRMQFVIQLNPPLEKWIIELLGESGIAIEDFEYSKDFKKLKKQIKADIDSESDEKLNRLVNAILKLDCESIRKINSVLKYLKEKNYQADTNELINV